MAITVGMPLMKLSLNGGKSKVHSGKMYPVTCEALEERKCKDHDLDRSRTKDNKYYFSKNSDFKSRSGKALCDYWEDKASKIKRIDKNGNHKKLRSDAPRGLCGIIKPSGSDWDSLSEQDQDRFTIDSLAVVSGILKRYGIVIDVCVSHKDEQKHHPHWFAHDPDFDLTKKLDMKGFNALTRELNETTYIDQMREKGWDLLPLGHSGKGGYSSEYFKKGKEQAKKEAEKIIKEAEQERNRVQLQERALTARENALREKEEDLTKREEDLTKKEEDLKRGMQFMRNMQKNFGNGYKDKITEYTEKIDISTNFRKPKPLKSIHEAVHRTAQQEYLDSIQNDNRTQQPDNRNPSL